MKDESDVDDPTQLLNSVQEHVTVLDARLVLMVLCVRSISFYDAIHLVDLAVESSGRNKTSQFLIDKGDGNAKSVGHVLKFKTSVRLQQLVVSQNSHLANIITIMWLEQAISLHKVLNPAELFEKFAVIAFVKRE